MADQPTRFNVRLNFKRSAAGNAAASRIAQDFATKLARAVGPEGMKKVEYSLLANASAIQDDLAKDINTFARQVSNRFLSIQSPDTRKQSVYLKKGRMTKRRGKPVAQNVFVNVLNSEQGTAWGLNVQRIGPAQIRYIQETGRGGPGQWTLSWAALDADTIRKKRGLTFFVDTGALKSVLSSQLGDAFARLINPRIDVFKPKSAAKPFLRVRALVNPKFNASLFENFRNQDDQQGRAENLIVQYLKTQNHVVTVSKLANLGGADQWGNKDNRHYRPFLQPMLAFWVLNRFPPMLMKSLVKAINKDLGRGRRRGGTIARQFEGT